MTHKHWIILFALTHTISLTITTGWISGLNAQLTQRDRTIAERDETIVQTKCNLHNTKKMLNEESQRTPNVLEMYERARIARCKNHEGEME